MIPTHPTDLPRFTGWHRPSPSRPWRQVVEAESEAEALDLLAARVGGGQVAVTASGNRPGAGEFSLNLRAPYKHRYGAIAGHPDGSILYLPEQQ